MFPVWLVWRTAQKADMLIPREGTPVSAANGRIYATGSAEIEGKAVPAIEEYRLSR